MPEESHHEVLAGVPPPTAVVRPDGASAHYRARRTLGIGVELRRQLTRRRTQIALGFQAVLPFLLIAAFLFGNDSRRGPVPGLVDLATEGAGNFTVFTLFVSCGFLLVVVVALFAGDTVASEASWSSLRYLLAAPVPRSHLLRRKLIVALLYSVFALVVLPAVAFLAGVVFFGDAPLRSPTGDTVGGSAMMGHLVVAVVYIGISLLFVAALAFLLSVITDAPLGAVGGAVMIVIVSNILDAVTALGSFRQVLPTHYSFSWLDVVGANITWDSMLRGALWSIGYSAVFFAAAWWHFERKDVTS